MKRTVKFLAVFIVIGLLAPAVALVNEDGKYYSYLSFRLGGTLKGEDHKSLTFIGYSSNKVLTSSRGGRIADLVLQGWVRDTLRDDPAIRKLLYEKCKESSARYPEVHAIIHKELSEAKQYYRKMLDDAMGEYANIYPIVRDVGGVHINADLE